MFCKIDKYRNSALAIVQTTAYSIDELQLNEPIKSPRYLRESTGQSLT